MEDQKKMEEEKPANRMPILGGDTKDNNMVFDHYFGTAEKTEQKSGYVPQSYLAPYNPDDLFQKYGDHSIFEEMANDDQVSVCLQLKKDLVIGSGWDIISEEEETNELADDIYSRLEEDPDESLDDYLDCFLDNAYTFGFALAEKRFQKRPDKTLTLKSLKTRHPDSWLIHTDKFGNVEKYEQHGADKSISVNPKSLIHYTPNKSTVGPYGRSDLRKVYDSWFVKRHITRFYSIFLEKAASPIPVAKYPDNFPDDKIATLFNIVKKFQTKTALTVPDKVMIEFLESKSDGEAFIKGLNIFNMFIGRGLFIPDLLGYSGSGSQTGGSQALGREQVEMFLKHIGRRRRSLERIINKHIIQPMCIYNHGFMNCYPKFQLRPITEEDTKDYARIFLEAVKGKFYKITEEEVNHFRSLIKFPESDVELIEDQRPAGQMPMAPDPRLMPDGLDPNVDIQETVKPGEAPPEDMTDKEVKELEDKMKSGKKEGYQAEMKPYLQVKGDYHSKVNFKALEAELDSSETGLLAELRPVIEEIFEDLYAQMTKKKIVGAENSRPEKMQQIKLKKLKLFQQLLKKHFRQSYVKQATLAQAELFKQQFSRPIPPDEFLERILEQETFQYVGEWEYRVTQAARLEMINAIKDGRPISSVIDILDADGKKDAFNSVERYSRTKFTEIMNRARVDEFEKSKVIAAYQYSAILDGRTSEICAGLHGKVFEKGKQPVPPLHFNCRSTLIPITIFEEYEPDSEAGGQIEIRDPNNRSKTIKKNIPKQPIDQFIDENIGKGFSRG